MLRGIIGVLGMTMKQTLQPGRLNPLIRAP